jgi:quinoprotein glucose dehydrogenase
VISLTKSKLSLVALLLSTTAVFAASAGPDEGGPSFGWDGYGGNKFFQRYSPLQQIDAKNVSRMHVSWQRRGLDASVKEKFAELVPSNYLKSTPTMVDGVLYASDAIGLVEAFDAATGGTKWVQSPAPATLKDATGESMRGVEYWREGADQRIVALRTDFLYELNAKTGEPIKDFGDGGKVYLGWPSGEHFGTRQTSAPIVVGNVIVVGGTGGNTQGAATGDSGLNREAYPEDIRGYDVRTGRQLWTFHVLPREGEKGLETWGKDSWRYSGDMGNWAGMSADEELGYVYVPLTAPNVSYYGGHRPGDNLYANSLVALDARTGKLMWHYQFVHHDLWDYDTASPPVLGDIKVGAKTIKAVMQANKVGFLYVFDRKTGEPVWPIEEKPVPQSTVPGEAASATQPIPTKLPPFDLQGIKESDLMDFTPALRAEAKAIADQYVIGGVFTPPTVVVPEGKKGTLALPGVWGSGNWNTGAFDPETGFYYAVSRTEPTVYGLTKLSPPATLEYSVVADGTAPPQPPKPPGQISYPTPPPINGMRGIVPAPPKLPSGLPLLKPPYGRVTAYDIGKGDRKWVAPNGDDPAVRSNPALKGVKLPPLLGNTGRGAPLVTKTLLFLADSSDAVPGRGGIKTGAKLRAYDKASGKVVAEFPLPAGATGAPMSYEADGKQYVIVPVGGAEFGSAWIAFSL